MKDVVEFAKMSEQYAARKRVVAGDHTKENHYRFITFCKLFSVYCDIGQACAVLATIKIRDERLELMVEQVCEEIGAIESLLEGIDNERVTSDTRYACGLLRQVTIAIENASTVSAMADAIKAWADVCTKQAQSLAKRSAFLDPAREKNKYFVVKQSFTATTADGKFDFQEGQHWELWGTGSPVLALANHRVALSPEEIELRFDTVEL